MLERKILAAEVVYNGLGTARAGAGVVVQGSGVDRVVVGVDRLEALRVNFPEAVVERVGFAISPALVNAHTHVDLSRLPYFEGPYEAFIRHVIARSREVRGVEAAREGVAALRAAGVSVVGDIVANEDVMRFLLAESGLAGVAYWEVIGPNPNDAERLLRETEARLEAFRRLERPGGMRVGLSPHTPHTVSAPLLQGLARLAAARGIPLQIHVAESEAEAAFHRDGSGALAELLRAFGAEPRPSGRSPVGFLRELGVLDARPTLVHMVHVSEEDVRDVQRAGCVVVHCPRSNRALECGRFPWELFMRHGVEVALGTDSLGSSPSLSVVDEAHAALEVHGARASALAVVRAAVKGGFRALGMTPPRFVRGESAAALHVWPDAVR